MGSLDHKIHIYWSRSLDYSLPVMMDSEKHSIFLVSSSQERTIRIWKMTLEAASSVLPYWAMINV
jgi:elongator complex protein 2